MIKKLKIKKLILIILQDTLIFLKKDTSSHVIQIDINKDT
jgi:hypothetical protein